MATAPPSEKRWTWQQVLKRSVEVWREESLKSLWFKILGEAVYRRVVLLERPLDEPIAEIRSRIPLEVNLLRESEVDEYIRFRPEADPSDIRRRLEAGRLCFVVRHEGRIVHACWVTTQHAWIDYLAREVRLAPDEVYSYEGFTAPGFRGQKISAVRSIQMMHHLRDAGYRRLVGVITPENKPSFRSVEKLDYRPLGVMGYVKLGPWRWDFCRVNHNAQPPGAPAAVDGLAYWNGLAQSLENKPHYLDAFLGALKRQAYLTLIERWGGVPTRGCVLKTDLFEEAMGPDAFLKELSGGERTVIGIDLSSTMTFRARNRIASQQVYYAAADVRCLPFADDSFALIVSPSTLDHFADPRDLSRSLRELARVLKPDGRLIITLDNRQNIFDPLLRLVNWLGWMPYYLGRSYRMNEMRAELAAAGFTVQETTAILHNPRLVAVASVTLAAKLGWSPLIALVRRALVAAQRLEQTRLCYYTGSFVAAKAVRKT